MGQVLPLRLRALSAGPFPMRSIIVMLLVSTALPCAAADIKVVGDKVYVLGTIEALDWPRFDGAVKGLTQPMTVVLHSPGGYTGVAYRMALLIRDRKWSTHVEHICNSACTIAWLGGVKKSKTPSALIGFHSTWDPDSKTTRSISGNVKVADWIVSLGYSKEVGEYGQRSLTMTYLTPNEARRLGILMTIVPASIPRAVFAGVNLHKMPDRPPVANVPATYTPPPWLPEGLQEKAEELRLRVPFSEPAQPIMPWPDKAPETSV